jgi:FkbM family methyltransferase
MDTMLGNVASPIRSMLRRAGIAVSRIRPEPYQELWDVPRFTPTTVQLLGRPFTIADSRSFFFSYREIFVEQIYRFESDSPRPRVIDCGSNYGTSVVYFHQLFPNARITAVEADPEIHRLLVGNCSHTGAELLQRAVSSSREPVRFYREGSDGGRAASEIADPLGIVEVASVTLDDLIDGPVDFLKIDIEGSEGVALEACTKLGLVSQMFIEYHSFKHSPQMLGRLLDKLAGAGFRYYIHHQFCSPTPLTLETLQLGMDLQLNIFAKRPVATAGTSPKPLPPVR